MTPMRAYELICVGFFAVFMFAAPAVLRDARRGRALAIGSVGVLLVWSLPHLAVLPGGAVLRDFLPGFILLLTYWQSGQFVVAKDTRFQEYLARLDRRWLPGLHRARARLSERPGLTSYFEAAYLMCYPTVPLGVAVVYLAGRADVVDAFWLVVLPATLLCQATTTLFQSWPPWLAYPEEAPTPRRSGLRRMNQWVTDHASIRANTFPSGHVACSFAVAFVLLTISPGLGVLFLGIAASTAVSTVLLGYHYSLDVVLGLGVAAVSFLLLR